VNGKIYFASDFHFGIPDRASSLVRESRFTDWLDMVQKDAAEIYLMGDLFDFWFEYKTAIPKGYSRLLGKLAEVTDKGIKVHLFRGNHDMWAFSYLTEELNIQLHRDPEFRQFGNKSFYLAHGDGLGPGDQGYKFIKKVFACRFNQWLFRWMHPDWGISMALFWSRRSRHANLQKEQSDENRNIRLIETRLVPFSEECIKHHPGLDFLVYGHYHFPYEKQLNERSGMVVLGDWLTHFTYGEFDGETLNLKTFNG
jgi:UDP-2,3-diacylglucosamine hydrolase